MRDNAVNVRSNADVGLAHVGLDALLECGCACSRDFGLHGTESDHVVAPRRKFKCDPATDAQRPAGNDDSH
jgi:hypothetical protein